MQRIRSPLYSENKFTLKNKNMKSTLILLSAFALTLSITSCEKGDTGPNGTAGTNGTNGVVPTSTDGFIKGNVSGTRQDGTAFNEAFEYKNYYSGPSATLDSVSPASFVFEVSRANDFTGTNAADVTINTTSKTSSTGSISLNNFSFTKSLGTNKLFEFKLNNTANAAITGLSYNASTGLFTGNFAFSVIGAQNTTGNTASINGSFSATVTQLYNFVKNTTSVDATN